MKYLKSLYKEHVLYVTHINNWRSSLDTNQPDYRSWMRAETYLRLDVLIDDLQTACQQSHIPQGIDAVWELVFLHTGLPVAQARQFSFAESLAALRPALESQCIPPEVLEYPPYIHHQLQSLPAGQKIELPPYSKAEWNHSLLKKYQDLHSL
ncbi:hypothetical protein BHZ80_19475 [Salmonella enterica]|nr:hypothetical protein [Salmonella enterica]EAA9597711.1 hypothetical protein [Salmonella enterica]EAO9640139.1 hypothetical protein [Salmonella enterica]EKI3326444.1 hypothetical protein [Salmonella enterica]